MKIYTCALMPFVANKAFFSRDSGLLCRTLKGLGIDSKVILPSLIENEDEDTDEVIRVCHDDFEDPSWWKSMGIDGVVFITWGFRKHSRFLTAARESGIITAAIIETEGNSYPYFEFFDTIKTHWQKGFLSENICKRLLGTMVRAVYFAGRGFGHAYFRSVQIGIPHYAIFDTPSGMARCRQMIDLLNVPQASKSLLLGYPIPDFFSPLPKEQRDVRVVSIARWEATRHKRPHVLMSVIEEVLLRNNKVVFEILGLIPDFMKEWHTSLAPPIQQRVKLTGIISSEQVGKILGQSQILYCPSASDGIPLCVAEAICGGCSVAGLRTPNVAGLYWAINDGDGSFAANDSISSHADAVISELRAWEADERDPTDISIRWKKWFSASQFAANITEIFARHNHFN